MKNSKSQAPRFDDQTRYNWGYHDGALAIREGFSPVPVARGEKTLEQFLAEHFDQTYADGYRAGQASQTRGTYNADSGTSWAAYSRKTA